MVPVPGQAPQSSVPSYAAFVTRSKDASVVFVPLGTAAAIDKMVRAWRDEASGRSIGAFAARAESAYRTAAEGLQRGVWDPLGTAIADAATIFIVPDGLLNIVNFAALPDRDGRYLVERAAVIHYLSTERDLVVPNRQARGAGTLLAVGGAEFGELGAVTGNRRGTVSADCEALGRLRFSNLPGSLGEVTEISKMWPTSGSNSVAVLSGAAASETAVKRALGGRRVVHLATHGFFLGEGCAPSPAGGTRAGGGLVTGSGNPPNGVGEENPLLLSGLALAGANRRASGRPGDDDGILTAEEVASLNLRGVEWAVLSACDTGLGEIKAGEGVFGLRRAFQVAGVRTVIMSLWSVDDQATRVWMRALYEGRLQKGLTTAGAVHAASAAVLRDRRAKGWSTHPFYWAAFVAAGDWR
jgi:CHAT domain-containing protein